MSELEKIAFLFTDIEGSTRLWEREPDAMRPALARHDALTQAAVERHRGSVVKKTGDGVHAAFASPLDAVRAMLDIQLALADAATDGGELALRVRCGVHVGAVERRAGDYDGVAVNRAARVAAAAHGGQMLVTQAVVDALAADAALPAGTALRALGTVRLRDLAHAETLWQLVHPRLRADFPALRSLEATPNNLPQQLDSFVNRQHELLAARRLLQSHRLVTLFGAGGIGKSRLSVQLAAELLDDFPDGVWCVELAPLADGQRIAQTIASVLGVKEEAGRPVSEALARYVPDRRLLILLDNCEHLAAACAVVAKQLLQAGPQLKVLATSREALHVAGEAVLDVPALSVPDARDDAITPDALARHEAVRLFVDRAAAAQPAFRIGEHNARAVADICRGLDGLPLAIELAAARTRSLPVEAIAARLGDRLRLLSTQDRTVLPRQQTLRALIDWSHDLLTDAERALFRRMAVFAGGWSLEAAEAVGAGDGVEPGDVLDLLARLVEKSLVVMQAEGGRYRMLDTVAGYARERLRDAGDDEAATCRRHLDFYVALAESAAPELFGPEQGRWLARLDVEQDNLLAAQAWCARSASGNAESALRLMFALRAYWINRGLLALGHRATIETLALPGAQARTLHRCKALHAAGQLSFITGRYDEARRELEESLSIAVEIGDEERRAAVLYPLGVACAAEGDLVRAEAYAQEAVTLARRMGEGRPLAAAITALAQLRRMQGHVQSAEALYSEGLELARRLDDRQSIALALLNLAIMAIGRDALHAARDLLIQAIAIADEIGSKPAGQSALEIAAALAAKQRQWSLAARLFGAAEAQAQRSGLRRDAFEEAFLGPLIEATRVALGAAAFTAAADDGRGLSLRGALAEADDRLVRG